MMYKKTMIKKIEEETLELFLYSETTNILKFSKRYFYCDYKNGKYQEWNPKTGIIK